VSEMMSEGYYWIRIHDEIAISSVWQVGWYHVNYMDLPTWSLCGTSKPWPHGSNVEVGNRIEPPARTSGTGK
jgi:hypothetical protein